jgi:tetrahydromethanopterin S-methyltransferase subunit C
VQGFYFTGVVLSTINLVSIILAMLVYIMIFVKFHRANKKEMAVEITTSNSAHVK